MGITKKEALKRLLTDYVEAMKKAEENWAKIEERLKLKQQGAKEHPVKDWILQKEREKRSKDANASV